MASLRERYETAMKKPKKDRTLKEMEFIADYEGYAMKAKSKDKSMFSGVKKKLTSFFKGKRDKKKKVKSGLGLGKVLYATTAGKKGKN